MDSLGYFGKWFPTEHKKYTAIIAMMYVGVVTTVLGVLFEIALRGLAMISQSPRLIEQVNHDDQKSQRDQRIEAAEKGQDIHGPPYPSRTTEQAYHSQSPQGNFK